jgi:TfoX/Sxy family transcriptional regulator of competence genes
VAYDEDVAGHIRALLSGEPGVTERKMFGGLAFLVGGNMAVAASGQGGLMVRVDPDQGRLLLADPAAEPMVMRGREMTGWLRVDEALLDDAAFEAWIRRGLGHARSLPPK